MLASYDLMALAAAACWALSSVLSVTASRHLGAFAFTRWRMLLVAVLLWAGVAISGRWQPVPPDAWGLMGLSGIAGMFIGDTALFGAMNRLGPRRSGVLFATHAVFSAALGALVFGERMNLQAAFGAALTVGGVMTAILLGRGKDKSHEWETDRGHLGAGIALGLVAALGQAFGTLLAKPAMQSGIDPVAASAIRVSVACAAHFALLWIGVKAARARLPATPRVLALTGLSGFIAMGLGMTFILAALGHGDVGIVAVLSSVTPILVLPMLWIRLRRPPAAGAWIGAAVTVAGTALILSR